MSELACDFCGKILRDKDKIKAVVLADFVALKSKRIYAISRPYDCLAMSHYPDCHETKES